MKQKYRLFSYTVLTIIAILISFPVFWLVFNSVKSYKDIYAYPIVYFPQNLTLEHYANVSKINIFQYLVNSIIISLLSMFFSLCIGVFPAYAFARCRFFGSKVLLVFILLSQMFPMIIFILPIFKLWKELYLLNTMIGLVLSYLPFLVPLVIIFLRGFFSSVSLSLEDSSKIDGCNFIQTFLYIVLPNSVPGILAIGVYGFLFSWSELLFSMQILVDQPIQNMPVFLSLFVGEYSTRWGELFAGSTIAMLFPLLLFLFFQRFLVAGLTEGAVKG